MAKKEERRSEVILRSVIKVAKIVLILTIPTFYLWSGLIYFGAGLAIVILRPVIKEFLCDVYIAPGDCDSCRSTLLTCSKGACYRVAMNITIVTKATEKVDPLLSALNNAALNSGCTNIIKDSTSPVDAIRRMSQASYSLTDANTKPCLDFHCGVLLTALTHPDVVAAVQSTATTGCTDSGYKAKGDESACVCNSIWTEVNSHSDMSTVYTNMCASALPTTTPTTTTNTSAGAGGGGSIRRLSKGALQPSIVDADARSDDIDMRAVLAEDAIFEAGADSSDSFNRQLQATAAPAPAGNNADRPDYVVGDWSQCTCYQACITGIETRTVQCLAAACKDPKPPASQKCECKHCAHCTVITSALVFMISFFVQAGVAVLVWLAFVYMGSVDEASLVKLSWFQWFLGFFVKQLPPLTRLLLLVNIGQAVFMMFQTWVPADIIDFQPDCNDVPQMRFLSIFLSCILAVLLIMGRITRLFNQMMPYIYKPQRQGGFIVFRLIGKVQALLGP